MVATVVEAFTAAAVAEAFTAVVADFAVVLGFAVVVLSVAEAGSAVVARSAVESGFVAPEPSAAAFVAARFVAAAFAAAGVGEDGVGAGDSVLVGAGPIGDTPIRTDTHMILGGELRTMTRTMTPTIPLPPTRILTTTEILDAQTQLPNPTTGPRRLQLTIRGLPRRTAP